jgi:hypothetical protein
MQAFGGEHRQQQGLLDVPQRHRRVEVVAVAISIHSVLPPWVVVRQESAPGPEVMPLQNAAADVRPGDYLPEARRDHHSQNEKAEALWDTGFGDTHNDIRLLRPARR